MLESYLVSVAMKSTALLAAGLLCLRLLRRGDAAARHLVCLVSLASAGAVLLAAAWSPHWSFLISVPQVSSVSPPATYTGAARWSWPTLLAAIWALGALVMSARAAGGWIMLARVRRRSMHFLDGDGAEVRIANVGTPLACGVLRPLILLPGAARQWDEARLRAVLLHESAHVSRRDCLAKYVAQVSRALWWWNPLAWIVVARLNREQELACDEAVLSAGIPADTYATVLLDVARECSSPLAFGCAMAGSAELRGRLARILEWHPSTQHTSRRTALVIPLLLALMTGVSCAAKRFPAAQLSCGPGSGACIAPGTNLVQYVPQARPQMHK
jgi:beta-lactamase regulating signal transducer with metallopeptidase domain